ncbi:hypothetical protein FHS38_001464 [Streptomyces netropsis]|uniref:Uncharacterized protein n=1 Tax=Streptomyces netropsis TaxID=55404 RepID=A0A7W7L991_STRNE|nr:hypothetical protein [Streptomyces netropsis]
MHARFANADANCRVELVRIDATCVQSPLLNR